MKWDDLQLALAVARHGSHSAAARALGVTQPTVGRRLAAMERALGAPLFERLPDGLRLTRLGKSAVMNAEQIEARVLATERLARASNDDLSGVVRVTASDWLATRVLPAAIAELTRRAPGLQLHVVASARLWRLTRNEADLALRPARFDANGIYQRVVGDVAFGLYASRG